MLSNRRASTIQESLFHFPCFNIKMSDVVKVKSYLTIASLTLRDTRVPVTVVSVNKLILFPNWIVPGIIAGVFSNG